MNTLLIYDSMYGNTKQIALAIAEALKAQGPVRTMAVSKIDMIDVQGVDLLVVGCPTQAHGATPRIKSLIASLANGVLEDLPTATFDTRFHKAAWLTGSAAQTLSRKLHREGARIIVPPESFFVTGGEGPLEAGEIERAADWAQTLVENFKKVPAGTTV